MSSRAFRAVNGKVVGGRVVPSARFDLNAAKLRSVLDATKIAAAKDVKTFKIASDKIRVREVEHPTLKSIALARSTRAAQSLPIVTRKSRQIMRDSQDGDTRWILPTVRLKAFSASDPDAFQVSDTGIDGQGRSVLSAVLTVPYEVHVNPAARHRVERMSEKSGRKLTIREVPLKDFECVARLTYFHDGEVRTEAINGSAGDNGYLTFRFGGPAVQIAYDALTAVGEGGFNLEIMASYDAVARSKQSEAKIVKAVPQAAFKTDLTMNALSKVNPGLMRLREDPSKLLENKEFVAKMQQRNEKVHHAEIKKILASVEQIEKLPAAKQKVAFEQLNKVHGRSREFEAALEHSNGLRKILEKFGFGKESKPKFRLEKTKKVVSFEQTFDLNPITHGRHFTLEKEGTTSRLNPNDLPWFNVPAIVGDPLVRLSELELPMAQELHDKVTVFESKLELGRYVFVPNRYVIGHETDTGRALLSAITLTDPERPEENRVAFTLGVRPDLSPADLLELEDVIRERIRGQMSAGHEPYPFYWEFPTEIGTAITVDWPDALAELSDPILDGEHMLLNMTANSLTAARAMFDSLANRNQFLSGSMSFEIFEGTSLSVGIVASLHQSEGDTVQLGVSPGSTDYHVWELIGADQRISEIVCLQPDGLENQILPSSARVEADSDANFAGPLFREGARAAMRTHRIFPERIDIENQRYDIGTILANLVVSTNLFVGSQLPNHPSGLRELTLEITAEGHPEQAYVMQTETFNGRQDFVPFVLTWNMPITHYLIPEERVVSYRLRAKTHSNETLTTNWIDHNFGNNPEIVISETSF